MSQTEDPLPQMEEGDSEKHSSLFFFVQNWTGSGSQQITAVNSSFFQYISEAIKNPQ